MSDNNITKSNISTSGQLFAEIRQILIGARQTAYKAVNFAMVTAYWNIGRLIVEDEQQGSTRAEYGKAVLADLSVRLTEEFGKGFTEANLRNMRQFYQCFPNCYALRSELTWTHYRLLIRVQDEAARQWYMNEAAEQTWSSRQLDRQISVLYYERLLASKDTRPVREEAAQNLSLITPQEFIHDPYVLEFLNLKDYPALRETDIEKTLISNLQEFLLELGKGFCFVARQKRMRYEEEDFYVDLVFYHSILKCHVLIDLKLGKLTHQDVGQMDMYIRMYDELKRNEDDNPTIGIVLCSETDADIARYSIMHGNEQLFASKYKLYLPTEEELKSEIETQKAMFYLQKQDK